MTCSIEIVYIFNISLKHFQFIKMLQALNQVQIMRSQKPKFLAYLPCAQNIRMQAIFSGKYKWHYPLWKSSLEA